MRVALVAGTSASRVVHLAKVPKQPIGLGLQTTSCGIGVLVTEVDRGSSAAASELKVGDCILSIDDCVPSSPKDAVGMVLRSESVVKLTVIGDAQATLTDRANRIGKGDLPIDPAGVPAM